MQKFGLVLEGGAMRGAFTAGVLDYFLDMDFHTPYIAAVSAGATNGLNYVARQKGRSRYITIDLLEKHKYISPKYYFTKQRSIMNMDFLFNTVPYELYPFDFETYKNAGQRFVMPITDAQTGQTVYVEEYEDEKRFAQYVRATCSLPFFMPPVVIDGKKYFDGGITDSIPYKRAFSDGCEKLIVILTKPEGYVRKDESVPFIGAYPNIKAAMATRAKRYNDDVTDLENLEKEGKVFFIRPSGKIDVGRLDKDTNKLRAFYAEAQDLAKEMFPEILKFIER